MKMLKLLNHDLTEKQVADLENRVGESVEFVPLPDNLRSQVVQSPDSLLDLKRLADSICRFLDSQDIANVILPGGSPAFQAVLHLELAKLSYPVAGWFSHSVRQSIEEKQVDGSVVKKSVFNHQHWLTVSFS